jgi:hypothetical protein
MSKKSRAKRQKVNLDFDDDFGDLYDDDFDLDDISRDVDKDEWDDFDYDKRFKTDARRRIERRRDMKRLYSQLDEWEEFGARGDW